MNNLSGKIALITGGSRGIGFHIARALHGAGAKVIITGRNMGTLEEARLKTGENCICYVCDQRDPEDIEKMAQKILEKYGAPDILVNNAGIFKKRANVADMSLEMWNDVISTNLTGVFLTTKAFLPGMIKKNRGDIFMISSMSGKKGDPGTGAYAASKFGLQGFSQALNYEVRKNNIRVMVLNPSSVNTDEKDDGPKEGSGLYLHGKDIADLIVFLSALPGRTLIRDMDIWGTNPF